MDLIKSHHHLTLSVGGAQEDYDFHTRLLGLRSVKKTILFDGKLPIYHLYYGNFTRYEIGGGGAGHIIDHVEEPDVPQGSWIFGEGTVHHCAFDVVSRDQQQAFKDHIEGLGFTDASEEKDRQYFRSVYFRTPGGALFEAAYSIPEGFTIDEPVENFGRDFQLPPWFEDRRREIMDTLGTIDY